MASSLPPSNNKTVLITGINGYLAAATGIALLKRGYSIVGTARSHDSAKPLLKSTTYAPFVEGKRIRVVEVPDITKEGAFDEAVVGVHTILHMSSPFVFNLRTASSVYDPAIHGSTSILNSALKVGPPTLRLIIVTSSVAAITSPKPAGSEYTFTEADWNDWAESSVSASISSGQDGQIPGNILYTASKAAAEKAVWKWRDEHKAAMKFDLAVTNPTYIYGTPAYLPPAQEKLSQSVQPVLGFLNGELTSVPALNGSGGYVDIEDVVDAHVWALEHPETSKDNRWAVVAGCGPPQAIADILRKAYPQYRDRIPVGEPGKGYDSQEYEWPKGWIRVSTEKLERAMRETGWAFKGWTNFEESVLRTARAVEGFVRK